MRASCLAGAFLLCAVMARAQEIPAGAIGRVEGSDVSCETGTGAGSVASAAGPMLFVYNGSAVTVHSGQAKLAIFEGGEVDVCGPAKLAVLISGNDVTLALNFGRVRVSLPEKTSLRIFTPTIIGTPIDIAGAARDVTFGLSTDDSLCVAATSGAIQLEHQFTGEKLIVPQAGEFFLNAGQLLPVAGTPGSCECVRAETIPAAPRRPNPDYAITVAPRAAPESAQATAAATEPATDPETRANIEVSVLERASEMHPIVRPAKSADPAAPPQTSAPVYTAVLPPLTFMAGSPVRPPDSSAEVTLLIREARVSPEWEFTGHVESPDFAQAVQHALGEVPAASQAPTENQTAAKPGKKKGGFWATLKRAFGA